MTGPDPAPARLREHEIRPEALVAQQAEIFAADVARLAARSSEFVEVDCPACASRDRRSRFEKAGFTYVECTACRTLYVSPRPTPAMLSDYYTTSDNYRFWADHLFPATEETRRTRIFRPRVDRIVEIADRHGVPRGTILEVGAGFGTFCEEVQASGAFETAIGIEPTPDLAARCRDRGITVLESAVEDVDLEQLPPPDVVASFEVIEHLFEPRGFVEGCARILRPGGLLVLTCPSGRGFDVVVLEALSDTVDAEHLNYFNPASLSALVTSAGLEVVEVSTPGQLDVDLVRRKLESGEWDAGASPFLRQVLLEEGDKLSSAFQRFLAEHGLSSHLWLVARKPEEAER